MRLPVWEKIVVPRSDVRAMQHWWQKIPFEFTQSPASEWRYTHGHLALSFNMRLLLGIFLWEKREHGLASCCMPYCQWCLDFFWCSLLITSRQIKRDLFVRLILFCDAGDRLNESGPIVFHLVLLKQIHFLAQAMIRYRISSLRWYSSRLVQAWTYMSLLLESAHGGQRLNLYIKFKQCMDNTTNGHSTNV